MDSICLCLDLVMVGNYTLGCAYLERATPIILDTVNLFFPLYTSFRRYHIHVYVESVAHIPLYRS